MISKALIISTFVIFSCLFFKPSQSQSLPQSVINTMASRENRYHHYLWHNIRNNWNRLSSSTRAEITRLGWAPPRPARRYNSDGSSVAIHDNNSGEDFLYMHRQMIAKVKSILSQNGESLASVSGWKTLPAPGDPDWPVPPAYTIPGMASTASSTTTRKSSSFYSNSIRPYEQTYTNPIELRKMTLGELGSRIEITIHSWLHMRFSARSTYGYRPAASTLPDIDEKWDDPRYNWLGDTYSSHVHPTFWKIHGWVDDRIEDWRRANGLSSIRWKGNWEGGPMSRIPDLWDTKEVSSVSLRGSLSQDQGQMNVEAIDDTMKEVLRIFRKEGFETNFDEDVILDIPDPLESESKARRKLCKYKTAR